MKRKKHLYFAIIKSWISLLFCIICVTFEIVAYKYCIDLFNITSGIITGLIAAIVFMIYDKYKQSITATYNLQRVVTNMLDYTQKAIIDEANTREKHKRYHAEMTILAEQIVYEEDFKSLMILYSQLKEQIKNSDNEKFKTMEQIADLRDSMM